MSGERPVMFVLDVIKATAQQSSNDKVTEVAKEIAKATSSLVHSLTSQARLDELASRTVRLAVC